MFKLFYLVINSTLNTSKSSRYIISLFSDYVRVTPKLLLSIYTVIILVSVLGIYTVNIHVFLLRVKYRFVLLIVMPYLTVVNLDRGKQKTIITEA